MHDARMVDLTKQRLLICESRFERYRFGTWEVEEDHHWHFVAASDEFCRTVLFCADDPGGPCIKGHFIVRFRPGLTQVDECYAAIDGCYVGNDPIGRRRRRKRVEITASVVTPRAG